MSHVSDQPATGVLDDLDLYRDLYRRMLLIRGFEDLVQSLFLAGEVYGTTHLYSGQEAIATGFASVLEDRDRVAATPSRSASIRRSCSTRCSAGRPASTVAGPAR